MKILTKFNIAFPSIERKPHNRTNNVLRKIQPPPKKSITGFIDQIGKNMKKFCSLTSLHGFKYLGEQNSATVKVFWFCTLVYVFVICGCQIFSLMEYWNEYKIVQTQIKSRLNIWDIPFPAITFCSEYQLNKTYIDLVDKNSDLSEKQRISDYASFFCHRLQNEYPETNNTFQEKDIRKIFNTLPLRCNDTLLFMEWLSDFIIIDPCKYAQPVVLRTGLCFTINSLPFQQLMRPRFASLFQSYSNYKYFYNGSNEIPLWTPESGFLNDSLHSNPPWRVTGSGFYNAVRVGLNVKPTNFENLCSIDGFGMTLEVHSSINHPNYFSPIYLRPNSVVKVMITPRLIKSVIGLRAWSPEHRGCYYENEKYLHYYQVYTHRNCEAECRANKSMKLCGCIMFYDPREPETPICGRSQKKCIRRLGGYNKQLLSEKERSYFDNNCLCKPSCTSVDYDYDIVEVAKNFEQIHKVVPPLSLTFKHIAMIELYFRKPIMDEWINRPIIRFSEIVAKFGGIISLSVGCSIVSLFEVAYLFGLRHFLRLLKFIKRKTLVQPINGKMYY